ncbi:MAG TPA: PQQ-binding-like beta-propeller repeat protein, partial [Chloroflexota bacterium]|nr:PQQ-binding-like beta-propeller repeat protein [Chloroflexota bacterium]
MTGARLALGAAIVAVIGLIAVVASPRWAVLLASASGNDGHVTSTTTWARFDFDSARSGVNPTETVIGPTNVNRLTVLWQHTLPAIADGSPAFQAGRLFYTTKDGRIVALNLVTGTELWQKTTTGPNYTTSSPALDPSGSWVYSYGLDGAIHKYSTLGGSESVGAGWPALVTILPGVEKGSSSLNVANGRLYMTTSGYPGDAGHYDGHVVSVDLANGSTTVFNSLCSNLTTLLTDQSNQPNYCPEVQSGIWARAGAVVDPTNGNVFVTTGNGNFKGSINWGDSVLELTADLGTLVDTYTPTNQQILNQNDTDLGSTAPALIPSQLHSNTPLLAVQGGKDGKLRLLNRTNLNGTHVKGTLGGELQTVDAPGPCEVLTTPAVWTDQAGITWVFVADSCGLGGFRIQTNGGVSSLSSFWTLSTGGTSPIVV